MIVETKFNPGDEVFYLRENYTEYKDCPTCGGAGKIEGKDGKLYSCPAYCRNGKTWDIAHEGIEVGTIHSVDIHAWYDKEDKIPKISSIWYNIRGTGVIVFDGDKPTPERCVDSLKGDYAYRHISQEELYRKLEEITPEEMKAHALVQSSYCGTCKTRNY